jgi:hypothetical protein
VNELDNLEKLYRSILNIVHSGVEKLQEKASMDKELNLNDVRALEAYNKISLAALERFEKKPTTNIYSDMNSDDLLQELENSEDDK